MEWKQKHQNKNKEVLALAKGSQEEKVMWRPLSAMTLMNTVYYADKISFERESHGNKFTVLLSSYDFTKMDVYGSRVVDSGGWCMMYVQKYIIIRKHISGERFYCRLDCEITISQAHANWHVKQLLISGRQQHCCITRGFLTIGAVKRLKKRPVCRSC